MSVFDRRLLKEIRELKAALSEMTQERNLYKDLAQRLGGHGQVIHEMLADIRQRTIGLAEGQEKMEKSIVADLQSLSDAIDAQGQTIQAEAQEVKNQLDQMAATIADLRNQVSPDVQPLVDKLAANTASISAIFTGEPAPGPAGGRGRR